MEALQNVRILEKEEFVQRLLADQKKRKDGVKRKKKIVKINIPFKEEVYVDSKRIFKENFQEIDFSLDRELKIILSNQIFSLKVTQKRESVGEDKEKTLIVKDLRTTLYSLLLKYYKETEIKKVFFYSEGLVIQKGEADYVIKITQKKK